MQPGDEAFEQWTEVAGRIADRLQVHLPELVSRRVPVRSLTPGPIQGIGRLRFADGTTLLVKAAQRGDLGVIVRAIADRRALVVKDFERVADALAIEVTGAHRGPISLWVIGPDQPD